MPDKPLSGFLCEAPFEGFRAYRVYHKDKDRYYYHMKHTETGQKKTVSVARYMMCVHLGRVLEPHEEVDHVNGVPSDDRLDNFQILSGPENLAKLHEQNQYDFRVDIPCAHCGTSVRAKRSRIARADRIFCSRLCNSSFYGNLRREQKKQQAIDMFPEQA